jgi:hypothetical protein
VVCDASDGTTAYATVVGQGAQVVALTLPPPRAATGTYPAAQSLASATAVSGSSTTATA